MIAIIDADVICYRAAAVGVSEVDIDGEGPQVYENVQGAQQAAVEMVNAWTKVAKAKRQLLVFSDRSAPKTSFRHHICPTYKSKRPDEKPPLHDEVYDFLHATYKTLFLPGLEGDDTLGLLATGEDAKRYTVVTIDKDLLTVPCRIVNPDKPDEKPYKVTVRSADYHWMFQTITGDQTDNYLGAPGAGDKRAVKELAMARGGVTMWDQVLYTFADQFDQERWRKRFIHDNPFDEAVMSARCARILRHGEYDYRNKRVRLWHPDPDEAEWIDAF